MSIDKDTIRQQILDLEKTQFVYHPNNYNTLISINHILHKHKQQLLLPSGRSINRKKFKFSSDLFMHWFCDDNVMMRQLTVPSFYEGMIKAALRNSAVRFIAFPLVLHNKNNCKDRQTRGWNHMTLVLYDKKYKYIELFDPAGLSDHYNMEILPLVLFNVLGSRLNIQIRGIVKPSNICIGGGIQTLQENEVYSLRLNKIVGGNVGFCSIFSVLYLDMRLSNPDKQPSEVIQKIKQAAHEKKYSLTKYIVEYLGELQLRQSEIEKTIDSDVLQKIKIIEGYPGTNETQLSNQEKVGVIKQLLKILSSNFK